MKRYLLLFLLLAMCGVARAADDSNTAHQIPAGNASMLPNLQTFLGSEQATRDFEYGFSNFVDTSAPDSISTACLGSAGAGLTMNLGACVAYNAGYRSTCGVGNNLGLGPTGVVPTSATSDCPGGNSITFPDNNECWVVMDENTVGNNTNLPAFTRVTGTHYLTDCASADQPTVPTEAFDSQCLMQVTTSSGSITSVFDCRNTAQPGSIVIPGFPTDICRIVKCDWKQDSNITVASGGTAVSTTTSPGPWASTDCNVSHGGGCTGTADKLINIYDPSTGSSSLQRFTGTVVGFTDTQHITISAAYPTYSNVGPTQAMWETDNTTAFNLYWALLGTVEPNPPGKYLCNAPIMVSAPILFQGLSIEFAGTGMSTLHSPDAGCVFIPSGTGMAGVPVIDVQDNIGSWFHDFMIEGSNNVGGTPYAGLQVTEPIGASDTIISKYNRFESIYAGGMSQGGLGPIATGGDVSGTMSGDEAAAATSIAMTSAPTGLLPGAEVRFLDPTGNGSEVGFTTIANQCTSAGHPWSVCTGVGTCTGCYTAGANPILLQSGLGVAHTAASTTVAWVNNAAMIAGFDMGTHNTGNDTQTFDNLTATDDDMGFLNYNNTGTTQSVSEEIGTLDVHNFGIAVAQPNNGQLHIRNANITARISAGIYAYLGGAASLLTDQMAAEIDPPCGVSGSEYMVLFGTSLQGGGTGFGLFKGGTLTWPMNSCYPSNGDFIDNVAAATTSSRVKIDHLNLVGTGIGALLPTNIQPTVHSRTGVAQPGEHSYDIKAWILNDKNHQLQYADTGSANNGYVRKVKLEQIPVIPTQSERFVDVTLQGQDVLAWNKQNTFSASNIGSFDVNPDVAPTCGSLVCVGSGTGEDYYYALVGEEADSSKQTGIGSVCGPINCAVTLDNTTNYVTGAIGISKGLVAYRVFEGKVSHGSAAPALSSFAELTASPVIGDLIPTVPAGINLPPASFDDIGSVTGTAPPTTTASSGTTSLNGPASVALAPAVIGNILSAGRSQGQSTVANEPTFQFLINNFSTQVPGAPAFAAHWDMGQASGNITDAINSNTGTATNPGSVLVYSAAGSVKDSSNTAITFPGSTAAYFKVATNASLPSGDTITVCFAFKRGDSGSATNETLWSQDGSGLSLLFPAGSDQLVARQQPGTNMYGTAGTIVDTNYHWFCYTKSAGVNHLYLGDQNSFNDVTANIGGNQTLAPTDAAEWIGIDTTQSNTTEFNGTEDEVMVSKSAMSLSQLTTIWGFWKAIKYGNWWWMTDGTPGSCPVVGSGNGCEALYQPNGFCCDSALIMSTPTPTATPTQTPTATPTP